MKMAIASTGESLDSQVDPRFGRCHWLILADTDDMSFEALKNRAAAAGHGAGVEAAQMVANMGCRGVVASTFGPNAAHALAQGGLAMYRFSGGTVREAIEAVKAGTLEQLNGANAAAHSGDRE